MIRYLTPLLFALGTGWMWHYNRTQETSRLLLPFIEVLAPGLAGDPVAQAQLSVQIMGILTVLIAGYTVVGHLRELRQRRAQQEAD